MTEHEKPAPQPAMPPPKEGDPNVRDEPLRESPARVPEEDKQTPREREDAPSGS